MKLSQKNSISYKTFWYQKHTKTKKLWQKYSIVNQVLKILPEIKTQAQLVISEFFLIFDIMSTTDKPTWYHNFKKDGIATIENFISPNDCQKYIQEMDQILTKLEKEPKKVLTGFVIDHGKDQQVTPYIEKLWKSSETIDYFFEPNVFVKQQTQDEQGNQIEVETEEFKKFDDGYQLNFKNSICKVGHALHMYNEVFYDLIWRDSCKNIFKILEWENPRVPQSMYIFKGAGKLRRFTRIPECILYHIFPKKIRKITCPFFYEPPSWQFRQPSSRLNLPL